MSTCIIECFGVTNFDFSFFVGYLCGFEFIFKVTINILFIQVIAQQVMNRWLPLMDV